MEALDDIVGKIDAATDIAKKGHSALIPILAKEDIGYHVDKILDKYKEIHDALEQKPYLRSVLYDYMKQTMQKYKWLLYGAKTLDSIDKLTAIVELGAGMFGPEAEIGVKGFTETLECIMKIPYAAYYAIKSKDYVAPLYFFAAEVASLVPYAGEAIDMMDLYTNKVRYQMQKKTAERFLKNIVKK